MQDQKRSTHNDSAVTLALALKRLAANLTLFSMAKHTLHQARVDPYLQKRAANYLYTYMSLIYRFPRKVRKSLPTTPALY